MNELIPIQDNDGTQAVMGRDLYDFLGVETEYRHWFPRMVEYGFEEGKDYAVKNDRVQDSLGRSRERTNHVISLDMAKEISMIQRTDKGKQARAYFLECERRAKQPVELSGPELMAKALVEAQATLEAANNKVRELEAPAKSWNTMAAQGGDYSVSAAAKTLSRDPNIRIGRDQLFKFMRELGWIFRTTGRRAHWEAYQDKAINTGRLAHKLSRPFLNEKTGEMEQPAPTVRVTPKGLHELHVALDGSSNTALEVV
ncbi:antA/AntB antirepressor family protein [Corynebacterium striatum]|uniref:antA/AntB antirepressor family protein n=1 Tax=Corynebacterium striatum TaxID=43770 RepID=UPI002549D8E4|nr:antA/AntB antirepressor family protein [Corynebacterium striatum]MDK8808578.1 antA/AntB antirepressor family protein [Corynebacterium striatum]